MPAPIVPPRARDQAGRDLAVDIAVSSSKSFRPASNQGESSEMKVNWIRSPGMLLLAIWLILMNLVTLVPLIASLGVLLNVLGVAAGVLILIGR